MAGAHQAINLGCALETIRVLQKEGTLGVGAGQMNRVGSAKIALEQAAAALAEEHTERRITLRLVLGIR